MHIKIIASHKVLHCLPKYDEIVLEVDTFLIREPKFKYAVYIEIWETVLEQTETLCTCLKNYLLAEDHVYVSSTMIVIYKENCS